jgi:tetratricopeptide (TPR) repeat protein
MTDMSNFKAVKGEVREAISLTREPELLGLAATVLSRIGDVATLRVIIDRLETAGDPGSLALARAELLGAQGEYATALGILNSTTGDILLTEAKARICEKDHLLAEGATAYQQIVDHPTERAVDLPDEPAFHRVAEAYYHLGILYTQLGELDRARSSFDHYLAFLQEPDADFSRTQDAQKRRLELSAQAKTPPAGGTPRRLRK